MLIGRPLEPYKHRTRSMLIRQKAQPKPHRHYYATLERLKNREMQEMLDPARPPLEEEGDVEDEL